MHKAVKGFTLIELLVALMLIGLIASAAAPVMQLTAKRDKERELKKNLWQIRDAIDAYKLAVEDGLIKSLPDTSGYPSSLQLLVAGVENIQHPKKQRIYFLRRIPRDPFATDQTIPAEQMWGKRSYNGDESGSGSASSQGNSGEDIYDVYSLSHEVGINQLPYREW